MPRFNTLRILLLALSAFAAQTARSAEIGSRIAGLQLPDSSGEMRSLTPPAGKASIVVFWSYRCPVSLAYVDRVEELRKKYAGKGVGVVAVASAGNETPAAIRANILNLNMTVPVLLDPDGSVADRLGATHVPSVFLIDSESILRYKGAFDNNKKPGEGGRIGFLEDALDSLLAGRPVSVTESRQFGCAIRSSRSAP